MLKANEDFFRYYGEETMVSDLRESITGRLRSAFRGANIIYMAQLVDHTEDELRRNYGTGKKSMEEIQTFLDDRNLRLRKTKESSLGIRRYDLEKLGISISPIIAWDKTVKKSARDTNEVEIKKLHRLISQKCGLIAPLYPAYTRKHLEITPR